MAELSVRWIHGNSFPFLNIFEADSSYGVVLSPDAETQTRSREGRITTIETNAQGFRGPKWHVDSSRKSVLLLGDSQVFGYGVAWHETVAAKLQVALGLEYQVLNAAVPTWGPTEYLLAMDELTEKYRPSHVVLVANVANDWFEAPVPNVNRTSAQHGWAVRQHKNLQSPTWFPGRAWLANRSQLWFLGKRIFAETKKSNALPSSMAKMLLRNVDRLRSQSGYNSPLGKSLADAQELCVQRKCELLAISLPLDVQVHHGEWGKYRDSPVDMAASEILLQDFELDAEHLGIRNAGLLPLLRNASPGAFLPDDYHLSAHGHTVIASLLGRLIVTSPRWISHAR